MYMFEGSGFTEEGESCHSYDTPNHNDSDNYSSDSDLEKEEMEIALYSQIHYEKNSDMEVGIIKPEDPIFAISFPHFNTTTQDFEHEAVENLPTRSENSTLEKCTSSDTYIHEKNSRRSGNNSSQDFVSSVHNKATDSQINASDFITLSSDSDYEISISSESSEDMSDYSISISDSDCVILDDAIDNMGDIKVNVEDTQQKLIRDLTVDQRSETSSQDEKWAIEDEDRFGTGSIIKRQRYHNKRIINVECRNCRQIGHLSYDCPKPKKSEICFRCGVTGHNVYKCPNGFCFNCDEPGHEGKNCPYHRRRPYEECHRCYMPGHQQNKCPDIWRQYHLTTTPEKIQKAEEKQNRRKFCSNCGRKKHFNYECKQERTNKHCLPSYPFIAKYKDVWLPREQKNSGQKRKHDETFDEKPPKRLKVDKDTSISEKKMNCQGTASAFSRKNASSYVKTFLGPKIEPKNNRIVNRGNNVNNTGSLSEKNVKQKGKIHKNTQGNVEDDFPRTYRDSTASAKSGNRNKDEKKTPEKNKAKQNKRNKYKRETQVNAVQVLDTDKGQTLYTDKKGKGDKKKRKQKKQKNKKGDDTTPSKLALKIKVKPTGRADRTVSMKTPQKKGSSVLVGGQSLRGFRIHVDTSKI